MILIAAVILISGCAGARHAERESPGNERVETFAEVYRRSKRAANAERMNEECGIAGLAPSVGYVKPYIPVVVPPRVIKVWVPAHASKENRKVLVSGHWSFLMVQDADWYIHQEVIAPAGKSGPVPSLPGREHAAQE
jgi:hypothetical protein